MGDFKTLSDIEKYMKSLDKQVSGVTRDRLLEEEIRDIKNKSNKPFDSIRFGNNQNGSPNLYWADKLATPPDHINCRCTPSNLTKSVINPVIDSFGSKALEMWNPPIAKSTIAFEGASIPTKFDNTGIIGKGGSTNGISALGTGGSTNGINLKEALQLYKGTPLQPVIEAILGCKDEDTMIAFRMSTIRDMLIIAIGTSEVIGEAANRLFKVSDQPTSNSISIKCFHCDKLIEINLDSKALELGAAIEGEAHCVSCGGNTKYKLTNHEVDLDDHKKIDQNLLNKAQEELNKIGE